MRCPSRLSRRDALELFHPPYVQMDPPWVSEIDHTGDVGIVVTAPDMKTLFERAAWGMFAILTDPETIRPSDRFTLDVEATDREDLLVRWLSDLNFLHVTGRVLLSTFDIADASDRRLRAVVRGERIDGDRHIVHTEIKAVTYHALVVEHRQNGWRAQIIFDM